MVKVVSLFLVVVSLGGCSNLGVQPWERDVLATEEMALDADPSLPRLMTTFTFQKRPQAAGALLGVVAVAVTRAVMVCDRSSIKFRA